MNADFDAVEKHRKAKYEEACEAWDKLEQERLNNIFSELGNVETKICPSLHFQQDETLEKVRNRLESGDREAMLMLLTISTDSLRALEILPQKVRLALADGLEKMRDNLQVTKGFLPRKRGERSNEEKRRREYSVFFTAMRVEHYRHDLDITLDEAEAKVADESNIKQDLVHKYWKKGHREGKRQIEMIDSILNRRKKRYGKR